MRLEADKMGLTLSQEGARAIADMNDAFDRFGEAVKGVATQMVALLAPAIEMIVNFLTDALVSGKAGGRCGDDGALCGAIIAAGILTAPTVVGTILGATAGGMIAGAGAALLASGAKDIHRE